MRKNKKPVFVINKKTGKRIKVFKGKEMEPFNFKIEKGIPTPTDFTREKYPFSKMDVGDSFFAPGDNTIKNRLRSSMNSYGKRHLKKFILANYEDGIRVWRVA